MMELSLPRENSMSFSPKHRRKRHDRHYDRIKKSQSTMWYKLFSLLLHSLVYQLSENSLKPMSGKQQRCQCQTSISSVEIEQASRGRGAAVEQLERQLVDGAGQLLHSVRVHLLIPAAEP
jgi:hypothetical protein